MRLRLFTVTNYRSITKAEKLRLDDLTVLVGPNNEGKSNILEALVLGLQELGRPTRRRIIGGRMARKSRPDYEAGADVAYDWERDYPQSLQEDRPDGRTTMNFDFELTSQEVDEFYQEVGSRFNETLPLSLSFGPRGNITFGVRKQGQAQKALASKRDALAQFVAARVQIQYVPAVRTGGSVASIVRRMVRRELNRAADADPSYAEALKQLTAAQEPILANMSASITSRLQGLLPDVKGITVEQREERMTRDVTIIVDDGTPTDLTLKGDGVQSLAALAMIQHYSREVARAREFILAVEEPEAHLHPEAIHALRRVLKETAETQQVVITTHSPLFVNRLTIGSNIIVRKNRATPASNVRELREVLGVQAADNLASAEVVLVVEGPEDEEALRGLLAASRRPLSMALDSGVLTIVPLHGAGKMTYLLTQLRDSLAAVHAFLDDDDAGRKAADAAQAAELLTPGDTTMTICRGATKGSEFEDLVVPDLYMEAFAIEFNVNLAHPWTRSLARGKWSKRMPAVFEAGGVRWTRQVEKAAKATVARRVAESPLEAIKPDCWGVIGALGEALERKLDRRDI